MFGIVTRGAIGQWRVAEGPNANGDGRPDWRNAWSPRALYDATVAADPVNGPALGEAVCPIKRDFFGQPILDPAGRQVRDCTWTNEVAVMPHSNAVVLTHYGLGTVSVLELSGPDASGRYMARISAAYKFPAVGDPSGPDSFSEPIPYLKSDGGPCDGPAPPAEADRKIGIAPREAQTDPSSPLGDERFAVSADMGAWRYGNGSGCVVNTTVAGGIVEFSYNASAAVDQRIRPMSGPVLVNELTTKSEPVNGLKAFAGIGPMRYDHQGSLWVPSGESIDLSRLLGREAQQLTVRPGQATVVQAEQTQTMSTRQVTGSAAAFDVDSVASVGSCSPSTCTDPVSGTTGGYALGDEIPAGTVAEYRLTVPKTGSYRVSYRAADRNGGSPAQIRMTVNGSTFDTTVSNTILPAPGQEVAGPTLTLPAGTYTIQLSAPTAAAAGGQLDWMRFTRS